MKGTIPAQLVIDSLRELHNSGQWQCQGYVVMPDHVHFVVKVLQGDLSTLMDSFGKYTSRRINQLLDRHGRFWQLGFYDHALRGEKTLSAYLAYMTLNPVRAALVKTPEDWPFLSVFPRWEGMNLQ